MKEPVHEGIPVVILDTIGELGRLYSLGDIIFCWGSLVKTGGHNIWNLLHMVSQFLWAHICLTLKKSSHC